MGTRKIARARKSTRRPKARKAKTPRKFHLYGYGYTRQEQGWEIEGHWLTDEQFSEFRVHLEERWDSALRLNVPDKGWYARSGALSNVLHRHRPTTKAKTSLLRLAMDAECPLTAISSMRDYSWVALSDEQGRTVISDGADLIERLVSEAEIRLKKLRHFAQSIRLQGTTKLQDWTKRAEELEQIGKEARS